MVTLSERYTSERARVDHLRGAIVEALSGRNTSALLDYNPTSRLCVGVLPPALDEPDAGRAARRVRRKPDALGFTARVAPMGGVIRGRVTICLALRQALYKR